MPFMRIVRMFFGLVFLLAVVAALDAVFGGLRAYLDGMSKSVELAAIGRR